MTIAWKNSENPPLDSALNHSVGNVCSFARAMYSTGGPWNTLSEEEEERGGERDGDGDVRGGDGEEQKNKIEVRMTSKQMKVVTMREKIGRETTTNEEKEKKVERMIHRLRKS